MVLGGDAVTVENCFVQDMPGDGIILSITGRHIARNNRIQNVGNNGIHFGDNAQPVLVQGNIIENAGNYGIFFCWGGQRCVVVDNIITKARVGIGGIGGGGDYDRYSIVAQNVIRDSTKHGIEFHRSPADKDRFLGQCIAVTSNVIDGAGESGILLFDAYGINVNANIINGCETAIRTEGSLSCLVQNNIAADCQNAFITENSEHIVENGNLVTKPIPVGEQRSGRKPDPKTPHFSSGEKQAQ